MGSPGDAELVMLAEHNNHTEILLKHSSQKYVWKKQKRQQKEIGRKRDSCKVRLLMEMLQKMEVL